MKRNTITTHTLFLEFGCGHEYFFDRVPGGVSDWLHCICDSCQPYDAVLAVRHPCALCGGSMDFKKDALQRKLSEQESQQRISTGTPLFASDLRGEHPAPRLIQSSSLHSSLIDEVAAVNDSMPPSATPRERWKKVNSWLRFKIASLTRAKR